jgi:hypothetical protein
MTFTPESKLLDVGCKDELLLQLLTKMEKENNSKVFESYLGYDLDENAIRAAACRNSDKRGSFQVADATKTFPLGDGAFDIVFCLGTLPLLDFEVFEDTLDRLCSHAIKHLLFNILHFERRSFHKEICLKRRGYTKTDYYIHNQIEMTRAINRVSNKYGSEPGFHKISIKLSPEMSAFITGQKDKLIVDSLCLISL